MKKATAFMLIIVIMFGSCTCAMAESTLFGGISHLAATYNGQIIPTFTALGSNYATINKLSSFLMLQNYSTNECVIYKSSNLFDEFYIMETETGYMVYVSLDAKSQIRNLALFPLAMAISEIDPMSDRQTLLELANGNTRVTKYEGRSYSIESVTVPNVSVIWYINEK